MRNQEKIKTIFVLYGSSSSGKTTTFNDLAQEIIKKYDNEQGTDLKNLKEGLNKDSEDFSSLFRLRDIECLIGSAGDSKDFVNANLELDKENNCSIIICTTRRKGETIKAIKKMSPLYDIQWIEAVDIRHDNYKQEIFYEHLYQPLREARVKDILNRIEIVYPSLK